MVCVKSRCQQSESRRQASKKPTLFLCTNLIIARTICMALPFIEKFVNRDTVLKLLIRYRCKNAENIQKVLVVDNIAVSNGRRMDVQESKHEIYDMFPPRRQWVHVGCDKRKKYTSQRTKNETALLLTVKREVQKEGVHARWYVRLNERIDHIVKAALTSKNLFSKPNVTVIEKKRNEKERIIECRPICSFKTLDERIYASLYNKVFTHLFDALFYENSMAFRVPKKGDPQMLHLKAVQKIKDFRASLTGNLWVAECDMKKFYDSIDHDVIKKRFMQLLHKMKQKHVINNAEVHTLKQVIYSYIDCYNFYQNVFRFNKKPNHAIWKQIPNTGDYELRIEWVQKDIDLKRQEGKWTYRTKKHEKYLLGVPQGGALSGVIANVVMHFADMKLRPFWDGKNDFLYIRFCDDIMMIGSNENSVGEAFKQYSDSIKSFGLYMHEAVPFTELKMRSFWDGKTREPYLWGEPDKDVFPWITFVGYDINWQGHTRIRKASVKKEIKKQYEKRIEIEHLLNERYGRQPQWAKQFILSSVQNRMIGMSVGRVSIWRYKDFLNDYSWAKAFTELTANPSSKSQLRLLDRHRNLMLKRLNKFLLSLEYKDIKPSDKKVQREAVWYYGKPFSYYGQVLKDWD